jgi:tetratricopeptide (TPR) repeat protein
MDATWLQGCKVAVTGRMASLTRDEAASLIAAHGGEFTPTLNRHTAYLIVGQEGWPLGGDGALSSKLQKARRLQQEGAGLQVLSEEDFLNRLGIGAQAQGIHRVYSTSQLCRLLRVSRGRLQAWVRTGLIQPTEVSNGVSYFDFQQVTSARTLVSLAHAGVGPDRMRRSLEQLKIWLPELGLPVAQLAVIERDGRVLVRLSAGQLAEPSGQGVFEFSDGENGRLAAGVGGTGEAQDGKSVTCQFRQVENLPPRTAEQWFDDGCAHEEAGRWAEAAEAYRLALLAGGPNARTCFNLGNALYALGEKKRAAERYRQAVEIDRGFVEAWNNLGNTLAEIGEPEEALDALRKAVELNPGYADAHYNLADLLDTLRREEEAQVYWEAYLRFDASSEWGRHARKRLRQISG